MDAVVSHPDPSPIETLILAAVAAATRSRVSGYCLWWQEGPCPRLPVTLLQGSLDPMAGLLGNAVAPASV